MFTQDILNYLCYLSATRKQHSSRFSLSCHRLKTRTIDAQTMSGTQTLETWEWAACNHVGLHPLQCAGSAAVCAKRYCGILPWLRRMDIADTRVLCSAARRWGRHTVNCRQNRKAESCEICILTATVHKSVKSHCHARWYTEDQEEVRERICVGSLTLAAGNQSVRKHITEVFTVYVGNFTPTTPNCPLLTSFNCYKGLRQQQKKTLHGYKWLNI